jgi:phage FluMu protein Com
MLWKAPSLSVKCVECGAVNEVEIEMDNASFFANA